MDAQTNLTILFGFIIVGFLVFDLGFLNRKSHKVELTSAAIRQQCVGASF